MKHTRKDSMSILEAIEDIQKRTRNRIGKQTEKRLDTCARQFAKTLMDSYPDLMFWQNTPPDSKDLPKEKTDLVPEAVRQVWPCPVKTSGRIVGPWLLDVYAGSRKAVQFGNKWDEPYPFNYSAIFKDGPIPPEVDNLPQPLMRDFRADSNAIRALCTQAVDVLSPKKKKTEHVATPYILKAAFQVAEKVNADIDMDSIVANIDEKLERFDDGNLEATGDIYDIMFVHRDNNTDRTKIKIKYELDTEVFKVTTLKKIVFIRKIRKHLAQLKKSRQFCSNH